MHAFHDPGPVLTRVPDARVAPFPLVPEAGYLYLSLLIGIVPSMLVLFVSAVGLRRARLALAAIGIGALGFLAPLVPILAYAQTGADPNYPLIFFGVRLLSVALGFWAYKVATPHVRGHRLLEGRELPLLWTLGPAFAALVLLPGTFAVALVAPVFFVLQALGQ
jgi:hypothetical protein